MTVCCIYIAVKTASQTQMTLGPTVVIGIVVMISIILNIYIFSYVTVIHTLCLKKTHQL